MEQKKAPQKDYRRQSSQYFLIGLIVALSTTLLAFEYRTVTETKVEVESGEILIVLPDDLPPVTLAKRPSPPPPPAPIPPSPEPDPVITEPLVEPIPEPVVIKVTEPFIIGNEPEPPVVEIETFKIVEQMPEFPNGESGLYDFLAENTKYPGYALDNGIEAKLFVQFIVNKDGSISDVEVLNPQGYGFDEEAIRVVSAMPKWKPGKQRGKKVRVYFVLPINFALK